MPSWYILRRQYTTKHYCEQEDIHTYWYLLCEVYSMYLILMFMAISFVHQMCKSKQALGAVVTLDKVRTLEDEPLLSDEIVHVHIDLK